MQPFREICVLLSHICLSLCNLSIRSIPPMSRTFIRVRRKLAPETMALSVRVCSSVSLCKMSYWNGTWHCPRRVFFVPAAFFTPPPFSTGEKQFLFSTGEKLISATSISNFVLNQTKRKHLTSKSSSHTLTLSNFVAYPLSIYKHCRRKGKKSNARQPERITRVHT